jgi:hypothetical protein
MKDSLLNELITAESEALMDEDRDFIDNAILSNSTLTDIASSLDREIKTTDNMSVSNFNFDLKDPQIVQTLFSIPDGFNSPEVIEIEEGMLVLSLNTVKASELMPFEQVAEDALDYVKDEKATEAILALQNSIQSDENPDTTKSFITVDNFVGVKRFSSLLPAEVLQEAFLTAANQKFQITAANGDSYIMSIDGVKSPDDEFLDAMIEEYKEFDRNQVSNKMASLIFAQMRNSAKVNLQNL